MRFRNLLAVAAVAGAFMLGNSATRPAQAQELNHADRHFVRQATWGGRTEVILGHMALDKSSNPDVRALAQHMIDDHSHANEVLRHICADHSIEQPTDLGSDNQAAIDRLRGLNGWEFNRAFARQMVDDHNGAIALFQSESANGINEHLRHFADRTLPTLQDHLSMSQALDRHFHHHD